MAIFSNPIVLSFIAFGSMFTAIGLSFLLIRVSLKDQTRSLLRERLNFVKTEKTHEAVPKILLRKPEFAQSGKKAKLGEYLKAQLGLEINPKLETALFALAGVLIAGSIGSFFLIGFSGLLIGIFVVMIIIGTFWLLRYRRTKYLTACEEQLPEALDFIVRALRAGHAFPTSISLLGEELQLPLGPEFRRIFKEQELGISLYSAFLSLCNRVPIADMKYFVTAYQVNREIGGNLAEVLENISKIVRERFKLKRHVQALTAEGRMSAWVLAILPLVVALVLFTTRPEYASILIVEPLGQKAVFLAVSLWLIGIIVIRKLVQFSY